MQRHRGLALIVLLAVAGLAACGTSGPRSPGGPAQDYAGLIATLRAAGATVVESDMVAQPPLAVPSKVLQVNGELVRTYEYATSAAAADAASGISADGATTCYSRTWMGLPIGQQCASADFVAPIHWYESGRLLVLYVGSNTGLLSLLRNALGPQFAGAQ